MKTKKKVSHETTTVAILQDFGNRFKAAREAAGKSQAQVQEESGVSQMTISLLENGTLKNASILILLKLAATVKEKISINLN